MESTRRLYICLPEKYEEFKKSGEWDHGIVVKDLNPYLTQNDLQNYFQTFGTITECVMTVDKSSGWPKGVGFLRYSSLEEANAAEAAGPHCFGGFQIRVTKVITPKNLFDSQLNTKYQSFPTDVCVN